MRIIYIQYRIELPVNCNSARTAKELGTRRQVDNGLSTSREGEMWSWAFPHDDSSQLSESFVSYKTLTVLIEWWEGGWTATRWALSASQFHLHIEPQSPTLCPAPGHAGGVLTLISLLPLIAKLFAAIHHFVSADVTVLGRLITS